MNYNIKQLVEETSLLEEADKNVVLNNFDKLSPLETLKLEKSLVSGTVSSLLEQVQEIKKKSNQSNIDQQDSNKQEDQAEPNIQKPKKILSVSILTQKSYLGSEPPKAIPSQNSPSLKSLDSFLDLSQLNQLTAEHVTFGINDNADQVVRNFLNRVEKMLSKIKDIKLRRSYFMNFLQSKLFSSYLNTGITALRHPEIEPAKIVLNTLHQINPSYLNNNQFQYASVVCNQIRSLCAL